MCNQRQARAMCHFVPPRILQHIAQSEAVPQEARHAAARTLSADRAFRERRVQALESGQAPSAPGSSVSAAQAPFKVALVGPAAVRQPRDAAAAGLVLRRAVYDLKNGTTLPGTLARAEGDARTPDRQVNNVYDGVGITVKFFHTVFGRNAIDGKGVTPIVSVHRGDESNPRVGYNNAFWDGTQFAFGDGDGIIFDYFTDSLDIVAHELTHAITQYTGGIGYDKQAGGLNESISDVFAALAEQWFFGQTTEKADWLTGQNLFAISTRGSALRNIAQPGTAFNDPVLGRDSQIAHFSQYHDGLDVHDSSGIPNRAFYLVATGLGGYAYKQAGKIWYETLIDPRIKRVGEDITFKQWADVTVDQARDLFGDAASTVVRNAWISVGVFSPSSRL